MNFRTVINALIALWLQGAAVFIQAAEQSNTTVERTAVEPFSTGNLTQLTLGLIAVLVTVVVIAWLIRRVGGLNLSASGPLKVLGGMSMGARERVVLMQVGETQLLIGVSPGRIQTLHVLDKPVTTSETARPVHSFAQRMAEALARRRGS